MKHWLQFGFRALPRDRRFSEIFKADASDELLALFIRHKRVECVAANHVTRFFLAVGRFSDLLRFDATVASHWDHGSPHIWKTLACR